MAAAKFRSSSSSLGVPQGSVFGPLLFLLYQLPLQHILDYVKDISYHCYADGIQLYISFKPNDVLKVKILLRCLDSVRSWMAYIFLQRNAEKTEVLIGFYQK